MAAVKGAVTVAPPFNNHEDIIRVTYDFAKDGGATGALDLLTADGPLLITGAWLTVKTTCTSGGSATVIWGISGVDTDAFCTTTQGAVANLTAGSTILPLLVEGTPNVINCPIVLADAGKLIMTIGTATLTAGKIEFCVKVAKP